ncbi:MAG: NUDIX domain-containing protein [Clostridia bacterium]|nr:NUDIX domain-containing protein [Clostridia bacterium]
MERTRVAGIVPMNGGFAFMHRVGVKKRKDYQDYYTFPGGRLEEGETLEEGTIREIKEEFGIQVRIVKKMYEIYSEEFQRKEVFYLCEYVEGEFGTGDGPEFSNDPNYADCGKYLPEIVKREDVANMVILPLKVKDKFMEDLKNI